MLLESLISADAQARPSLEELETRIVEYFYWKDAKHAFENGKIYKTFEPYLRGELSTQYQVHKELKKLDDPILAQMPTLKEVIGMHCN